MTRAILEGQNVWPIRISYVTNVRSSHGDLTANDALIAQNTIRIANGMLTRDVKA